jgi:hypothetical protein
MITECVPRKKPYYLPIQLFNVDYILIHEELDLSVSYNSERKHTKSPVSAFIGSAFIGSTFIGSAGSSTLTNYGL